MATESKQRRTYRSVVQGTGSISFHDFERLLGALGFEFKRQAGSHRVYVHPRVSRPFPIQRDGKDAKRYQIAPYD